MPAAEAAVNSAAASAAEWPLVEAVLGVAMGQDGEPQLGEPRMVLNHQWHLGFRDAYPLVKVEKGH